MLSPLRQSENMALTLKVLIKMVHFLQHYLPLKLQVAEYK